jgi:hypothetical protein
MYQDYLADDPTCLLILDAGLYIYVLFGLVNPTGILIILYLRRFRMTQDLSISFIKLIGATRLSQHASHPCHPPLTIHVNLPLIVISSH